MDSDFDAEQQLAQAMIDAYETAVRAVCELEWAFARVAAYEPLASFARACADLTRDGAAVQLSTARWLLGL